jgi:hypothetical protein
MFADDAVNRIQRDSYRELHRDGLTELVAGVVLFIVALATGRPAFAWTYLAAIVVLGPGLTRLRARFTYPRIGFVELPAENRWEFRNGVLLWVFGTFALVALGLAAMGGLTDNLAWRRAAPLLAGVLFAGGLLYLAQRTGLRRIYGLTVASVMTGVLFAFVRIEGSYANLRVWAISMSLLCLTVGGLALRRFIRETPVAGEWGSERG